jgi:FxsC-like protein
MSTGSTGTYRPSGETQQAPYFFLSYAHTPKFDRDDPGDPNEWVLKLFRDLSQEVMELTDIPGGLPPGFMDRELRPGHEWPRRITEALATCRVFIPLYAPRYFSSENCGKEWYAFHRRQVEHEANGGRRPEAIVPVLWLPVEDRRLPRVARSLQFDHHRLGQEYAQRGFSQLIRINQFRDDYQLALHALAEHIVKVAHGNPPDEGEPADYTTLDCAFASSERKELDNRRLQVTVVAPDFYHLPQKPVSRTPEFYRPDAPTQWNPYRPESRIPLAEYTSNLARGMGLEPEVSWFDDQDRAAAVPGRRADPGLMLVDPWATLDGDRGARLREFRRTAGPWVQFIVAWNSADTQTVLHERVLQEGVQSALTLSGLGIPTLESFGNLLPRTINAAIRNYLREARPHPPSGERPPRRRLRDIEARPDFSMDHGENS